MLAGKARDTRQIDPICPLQESSLVLKKDFLVRRTVVVHVLRRGRCLFENMGGVLKNPVDDRKEFDTPQRISLRALCQNNREIL